MSVDVTVLVPTYNRAHYLDECLTSLLNQSVKPRQVLVIDDGSTDRTAAVVASYGARVGYLRQPNGGKASALNLGLGAAVGADIWIFDDDDIAQPDALRLLHTALHQAPAAGFAFGHYSNFSDSPDGVRTLTTVPAPRFEAADLTCALLERCFVFQAAMLVRRSLYDEVGGFDTSFVRAQDYEMLSRLVRHSEGVHVPEVVFLQRQHGETRGTALHQIDGATVWEKQKAFDAQVLDKVHRNFPLRSYLPHPAPEAELTPRQTVDALLRRAAVMARKKLWDLAGDDIEEAAGLAGRHGIAAPGTAETAMLRRVFDEHGYARDDLGAGNLLLRRVEALPESPFRKALMANLSWPVFRYGLLAVRQGQLRQARGFLELYRGLGGSALLPAHLSRLMGSVVGSRAG
ncbi:glycosyltransferase [Glacieibacterium sp.]|uniref:glycosyltransferase n=1 Tax=Glacieibacterium sp. TaxID=2860237 RepID=UPI003AFFD3F6